ncbi:MAG: hypothetical protein ACK59Y_15300 [Betaproteobacteria bacterium]|jgi:hypothetical protein|nr:hypothetical protein [Betaproteobacteria bacterium]
MSGEEVEKVKEEASLQKKLRTEGEKYFGLPPRNWPISEFGWDISPESQCFSFDGLTLQEFETHYPGGLILGWVDTESFDKKLDPFNHRTDDELWSVGSPSKLAYLIAYLANGYKVSPPAVFPSKKNTLMLFGGNHRYAIARALRQSPIPILCKESDREKITELLFVRWEKL